MENGSWIFSLGYYLASTCFIPGASLVGMILSLIGVVLGALGMGNPESKGTAIGGLVCSIIALVVCGIWFFACGGVAMCSACASLV